MPDTPDPYDVLRRINSRLGKTDDPFAVYQLEQSRDKLEGAIEEYEMVQRHHKVVIAGHQRLETDETAEFVDGIDERVDEQEQELYQLAAFLSGLLDAAEEGRNLREFIAERQQAKIQALQAQGRGPMPPG